MATRRVTFRLYPNQKQVKKLHYARSLHKLLYNAGIANRKTQYEKFKKSVDYFEQQNSLPDFKETWSEYKELNSMTLQATLKRVDFAYQRFFNGLGGRPKFKSIRDYRGWTYPDARQGFKVHSDGKNGYLELRDLEIKIQMRGKARTWADDSSELLGCRRRVLGKVTTCTIVFKQDKWYASITVDCTPIRETGTGAVGLDFGCKDAVVTSDGDKIAPPKFYRNQLKKIKQASKAKRRKRYPNFKKKIKGSKRWKKAQSVVTRLNRKAANQRQDWQHQTASQIVSCNSMVATEKLNLKNMTSKAKKGKRKKQKAGLNLSMLDVGIGGLIECIKYKLSEANGVFVEVPTQKIKPTQRCNKCWELTPKTLTDRVHVCQHCGHLENRDVNAAQVMLTWARGQELSSQNVDDSSSTSCGSMKQLSQRKRKKPCPQVGVS